MVDSQPDLLRGLSPDDASAVLALGSRLRLTSGAVLFELGAEAVSVYIVERGQIALTLPMQIEGREEDVLVEERVPRETLGWSALIPPHRFTLKATAQLESEVRVLARAALLDHFAARPDVGYRVGLNLAAIIGQRLQVFQAMWLREVRRVIELHV